MDNFSSALIAAADALAECADLADVAQRLRKAAAFHANREVCMRWAYFIDGCMRAERDADCWSTYDAAGRALERALEEAERADHCEHCGNAGACSVCGRAA